jgi:large subunit ribosomal protein L21
MKAVVKLKGHQYLVEKGQEFLVSKLENKKGDKISIEEVLLIIGEDEKAIIGNPLVKGAKVELSVLGEEKGKKVRVARYKAKSRYRKVKGFTAQHTKVKVEQITK